MKQMLIFKIWTHALPAAAAVGTTAFIFLWPSIPLGGIQKWLTFFYYYTPQNYFYALLSVLTGLYMGTYAYNRTVERCCVVGDVKTGVGGSLVGALLGACPACIPFLAFLLPLSVSIVLSRLSLGFLIIAVGIMLFSIYKMNGFKRF